MPNQQPEINQRLRCAAGHLNAVINMVEAQKPCGQVLHQICAVQGALRTVGILLISSQTQESETIIRDHPDPEIRGAELLRLQELYREMLRTPFLNYEAKP